MKKALVIGATGLIGKELVRQLALDHTYDSVVILARKKMENLPSKFRVVQVDFDKIPDLGNEIYADVLFSALGTTLRKAGSKEAHYKIDFGYQYQVAKIAADHGVKKLVLLSSAGASTKSPIFYSRMKGELDEAVQHLKFEHVSVIRPSLLVGKRDEFRLAEKIFTPLMYLLYIIPFARKYRPVKDSDVARAMRHAVEKNELTYRIYELNAVFQLAKE